MLNKINNPVLDVTESRSLGKQLREIRRRTGLTLKQVGEETGINKSHVRLIELGIGKTELGRAWLLRGFFDSVFGKVSEQQCRGLERE